MYPELLKRHFSRQSSTSPLFKINNPFKDKEIEDIDEESEAFAHSICHVENAESGDVDPESEPLAEAVSDPDGLERLFKLAGRIAYNPPGWRNAVGSELSHRERRHLRLERKRGIFQQTSSMKFTMITLSLSAILQGWIQSTLNGANPTWWKQTGLNNPTEDSSALWKEAGTNAIVFFAAGAACGLSDPLQSRYLGRRGILFLAAVMCLAAAIGAACVHKWEHLFACRVLLGIAMGLKGSVTSIFAAEVSPCHLRGAIVMSWQAGDTLGIFLGFSANLIVQYTQYSDSSWRWQTASVSLPALCLMVLIWTIPDSPRLYLKRGKYREAFDAMCLLRGTPLQAARDLFYANAQLQLESDELLKHIDYNDQTLQGIDWRVGRYQARVRKLRWWDRVWALVSDKRTRRSLQSALIVMVSQQLCGFNVLAFYSNTFFSWNSPDDKQNSFSAGWLSWGIGLCNFVFTLPAFWLIDDFGRVALLLATYPGMIAFMLATCLVFVTAGGAIPKVAVESLVYLFTFFFSLGQGPVAFTYSAEVFPLVYRESGMSVAVATNLLGAGLLTLFVPQAQFAGKSSWADKDPTDSSRFNLAQAKMLGTFVGLEVLAYVLIFCFVPETARCTPDDIDDLNHMSLEELNCIFEQHTFHHTFYRFQEALPNTVRQARWWLCRPFTKSQTWPGRPTVVYRWPGNTSSREKGKTSSSASQIERISSERERNVHDHQEKNRPQQRSGQDEISPAPTHAAPQYLDISRQASFRVKEFEPAEKSAPPSTEKG